MKYYFKIPFTILLICYLYILRIPNIYSFYGAGSTSGWDIATDGINGSVTQDLRLSPSTYNVFDTLHLNVRLTNTQDYEITNIPLYLHIFRITQSPIVQNLSDNDSSSKIVMSDSELRKNTIDGNDVQVHYTTIPIQPISIPNGQMASIPLSFNISTPGYYQYDLSSYPDANNWKKGYIYVAGYIRVLPSTNSNTILTSINFPPPSLTVPTQISTDTQDVQASDVESQELSKGESEEISIVLAMNNPESVAVPLSAFLPVCNARAYPFILWLFFVTMMSLYYFIQNKRISVASMFLASVLVYSAFLLYVQNCFLDYRTKSIYTIVILITSTLTILMKLFRKMNVSLRPTVICI